MAEQQVARELKQVLLGKLKDRAARVGVIGLGYVGLPLAEVFSRAGLPVTGFDVDGTKVDALRAGKTYIEDLTDEQVAAQVNAGRLGASLDFEGLSDVDVIVICVPTPLRKTLDPDISYIVAAVEEIKKRIAPGQLIILESTTYPGTTDEVIQPLLEEEGFVAGEDFFLAFSPERVDPSNEVYKTENTPKVVGGSTPDCAEVAAAFYRIAIPDVHVVSSARAAEMVKLLENTFRLVNIGFVNEFALISDKLGIDVWEVIDAAATKPFGFMPFYPGPGLGGHCIPIDPHYLSWKLRSLNYFTRFIDLAAEINRSMPAHVVTKLAQLLNDRKKPLNGSRLLVVGVAYKKNTGDIRESPAIDVAQLLMQRGAGLSYHDPFVDELTIEGRAIERVELTPEVLAGQDAVVILTAHDGVDHDALAEHAPIVFDTRNATSRGAADDRSVTKL
ncbi:MAG: nucleotide sugar dehydrogenase [Acidobacteriota bacterium]|nr:nucleotide sugar dehydrogenase [Acidobacteriota bacterium]